MFARVLCRFELCAPADKQESGKLHFVLVVCSWRHRSLFKGTQWDNSDRHFFTEAMEKKKELGALEFGVSFLDSLGKRFFDMKKGGQLLVAQKFLEVGSPHSCRVRAGDLSGHRMSLGR